MPGRAGRLGLATLSSSIRLMPLAVVSTLRLRGRSPSWHGGGGPAGMGVVVQLARGGDPAGTWVAVVVSSRLP